MTNTYAINTTRNKEFEVERELTALGLHTWVPKRLASRYVKEKRASVWYDTAYVPKLIFCVFPAVSWPDVLGIKHVIGKPLPLSERDIRGNPAYTVKGTDKQVAATFGLRDFQAAVNAEYDDMKRRQENSEYQCQYTPGQALEILSGPFAGMDSKFKTTIKRAHDDYAKLRVEVMMFGGMTAVDLDPDVLKAG